MMHIVSCLIQSLSRPGASFLVFVMAWMAAPLSLQAQGWILIGQTDNQVNDLIEYNGNLVAAGNFKICGGGNHVAIASWDGNSWNSIGSGFLSDTNGTTWINDLEVHGNLFVAGDLRISGSNNPWNFGLTFLDGGGWNYSFADSLNYFCLGAQHLVNHGASLFAAGDFCNTLNRCGYANFLAQWNGVTFQALDTCATNNNSATTVVRSMVSDGSAIWMGINAWRSPGNTMDILGSYGQGGFQVEDSVLINQNSAIHSLQMYSGDLYAFFEGGVCGRWAGGSWDTSGLNAGLNFPALYPNFLGTYGGEMYAEHGGNLVRFDGFSWENLFLQGPICMAQYGNKLYGGMGDGIYELNDSLYYLAKEEEQTSPAPGMKIFPNPASGTARVMLPSGTNGPVHFQLYELSGKMVAGWKVSSGFGGSVPLPIEGFPDGIYFLQAQAGNAAYFSRLWIRN